MDSERNLDELLDLADSPEERRRIAELWTEMDALPSVRPPAGMAERFHSELQRAMAQNIPRRFRWSRAAVWFGVGLLSGVLAMQLLKPATGPIDPPFNHGVVIAASKPDRPITGRLAAVHLLGSVAPTSESARRALIDRALHDPNPAIQLAAIGHLHELELPAVEVDRLAEALPRLSPIVQLTLLDFLTPRTGGAVMDHIKRLSDDESAEALIRRHAARTIAINRERNET